MTRYWPNGMTLVGLRTAMGLAGSLAVANLLKSLLFSMSARDTATYVAVVVLIAAVGILADSVPARRAARVRPDAGVKDGWSEWAAVLVQVLPLADCSRRPLRGNFERAKVVLDHHPHAAWINSVVLVPAGKVEPPRGLQATRLFGRIFFGQCSFFFAASLILSKHRSVAFPRLDILQETLQDPFPS